MGRSLVAFALAVALGSLVPGCAHDESAYFAKLSEHAKSQYAKYQQFMTHRQQDHYLRLPTDGDRDEYIGSLHVEDRLARYPKFIQNAIWSQQVVPGMDKQAVMLSIGPPDQVERHYSPEDEGLEKQVWIYPDRKLRLHFVGDKLTEVERP